MLIDFLFVILLLFLWAHTTLFPRFQEALDTDVIFHQEALEGKKKASFPQEIANR